MAIDDDIVCTITLTSGSVNFTVAGTNLTTADIEPGDEIRLPAKGLTLTVGEVLTATTGKLTDNCPAAAAGAAQPARLRYQADLSRAAAKFENLTTLLGAGNVDALAGLALANNKGIYATGLNTLATYTLTAFGRSLGGVADAAAGRAALAAPAVGVAGLDQLIKQGTNIASGATTDIGAATGAYVAVTGSATITSLGTAAIGSMRVVVFGGGATLINGANIMMPGNANVVASGGDVAIFIAIGADLWRCISYMRYASAPPLMVRGVNANGAYCRFSNGLQICYSSRSATPLVTTAAVGSGYQSANTASWTFPAAFTSAPIVVPMGRLVSDSRGWFSAATVTATDMSFVAHSFLNGGNVYPDLVAVGGW